MKIAYRPQEVLSNNGFVISDVNGKFIKRYFPFDFTCVICDCKHTVYLKNDEPIQYCYNCGRKLK